MIHVTDQAENDLEDFHAYVEALIAEIAELKVLPVSSLHVCYIKSSSPRLGWSFVVTTHGPIYRKN